MQFGLLAHPIQWSFYRDLISDKIYKSDHHKRESKSVKDKNAFLFYVSVQKWMPWLQYIHMCALLFPCIYWLLNAYGTEHQCAFCQCGYSLILIWSCRNFYFHLSLSLSLCLSLSFSLNIRDSLMDVLPRFKKSFPLVCRYICVVALF